MTKVHALAIGHKADSHCPGDSDPVSEDTAYAYRRALCGQQCYSRRIDRYRFTYIDGQLYAVYADTMAADGVTCAACRRIAKFS